MYLEEVAKKIADETKKAAERMKNIHVTASVSYYQKNKTWLNKDVSLYPLFTVCVTWKYSLLIFTFRLHSN